MDYQKSPFYGPGEDEFAKISEHVCKEGFEGLGIPKGETSKEDDDGRSIKPSEYNGD